MEDNGFSAAHTRLFHPSDNSICLSEGRSGRRGKSNDWFTWRERERERERRIVSRANLCIAVVFTGAADMYVRGKCNKIDILSSWQTADMEIAAGARKNRVCYSHP